MTHPNRNHKSLPIGNHNFEVASFSRRNRSAAITQLALGQNNRCDSESHPCSRNVFWRGFQTYVALLKHYKNYAKLAAPESKAIFELRSQSLAICDFEIAAIWVTKALLRLFVHLHLRSFALIHLRLRSFALICAFLRPDPV